MKCKELMVGDLINNLYGVQMRVVKVYDGYAYAAPVNSRRTTWRFDDECEHPVPTPLTYEILKKNGFIKVNSQRYDYGYPDTNCYVKVNPKKNMIHVNGRNANSNLYSHSFVHELQRALRLCGLNELADNFKV